MTTINLDKLPYLQEILTRLSKNGEHINRASNAVLWANLEQEQSAYEALFTALGFDLRIDQRGFAWFNTTDSSASSNQTTRRLALFFMVLFEYQGDAGKPLGRFMDWRIDNELLTEVYNQHKNLLFAEGMTPEDFPDLTKVAERFGFMRKEEGAFYLLPAVFRYLDHFETLAGSTQDDNDLSESMDVRQQKDIEYPDDTRQTGQGDAP